MRGAGGLEADDPGEGHVVGEGEGAHTERRGPRHQCLGRGGATEEAERAGQMQLDVGVRDRLGIECWLVFPLIGGGPRGMRRIGWISQVNHRHVPGSIPR